MTVNDHESQQFRDLIKKIQFAMFTTTASDGSLRSRPMTTQIPDGNDMPARQLWFFMSRLSDPVKDVGNEARVCVTYADAGKDAYVSASGTACVVDDPAMKQRLWSKMNEAWFPGGPEDPDLALVCVDIHEAEYWSVKESKLVQLAKIAKASFVHERPHMGEHGKVHP
jgi:general stress protein 26